MDDWYKVTTRQLSEEGGTSLLFVHDKSLWKLLKFAYPGIVYLCNHSLPEHDWKPWKFAFNPDHIWSDPKIQKKFLEDAFVSLKLSKLEDWYHVRIKYVVVS